MVLENFALSYEGAESTFLVKPTQSSLPQKYALWLSRDCASQNSMDALYQSRKAISRVGTRLSKL